jgi:hypothetical protein
VERLRPLRPIRFPLQYILSLTLFPYVLYKNFYSTLNYRGVATLLKRAVPPVFPQGRYKIGLYMFTMFLEGG